MKKTKVLVGVSGGADSVYLLHRLLEDADIEVIAVHINHMLRGKESDDDEKFVEIMCDKLGVELICKRVDIKTESKTRKKGIEETAREVRYELFQQIARDNNVDKIAVAHHKDDQAETILMNLFRGAGIEGLTGMDYESGNIIRPLLSVSRQEIENYLTSNEIPFRKDSSNDDNRFTRNKIRNELIPWISQNINPKAVDNIVRASKILKDDVEWMDEHISGKYQECLLEEGKNKVIFNKKIFNKLYFGLKKRIIRHVIHRIRGNLKQVENIHIEGTLNLFSKSQSGSRLDLVDQIQAGVDLDTCWISYNLFRELKSEFSEKLNIPGVTLVDGLGEITASIKKNDKSIERNKDIGYNALVQFFDYDEFVGDPMFRTRQDGDFIRPMSSGLTKKLKKYFLEIKLPIDKRDTVPIVAINSEVIWAVGYTTNSKYKVTNKTQRILKLCFKHQQSVE